MYENECVLCSKCINDHLKCIYNVNIDIVNIN